MEEKNGTLDILISSLRYPFTNIGSTILGGFVLLFSLILIGIPFLFGYWVRICRETMKQNETLPAWNNLEELFSDGIRAFIIGILYGVVLIIIDIVYSAAINVVDQGFPNPVYVFIRIFLYVIFLIATFPVTTLLYISIMGLASTSDIGKVIDPRNGMKIFLKYPKNFVIAYVINLIVQLILTTPILLIIWLTVHQISCICLIILALPWMIFIMSCIGYYIFARYYRRVANNDISVHKDDNVPAP